jgi:hypothetical protein
LSWSIAPLTLDSSSALTPGSELTTRDTVFTATPAREATSTIVGRRFVSMGNSDNEVKHDQQFESEWSLQTNTSP